MPFEAISPILRVEDIRRALDFYCGILGFNNSDWSDDQFTGINSGGQSIYLCRGGQGRGGAWVWIGCDNARELHARLKARGVKILLEPTNFLWALEFQVEDPDGNVLRFGSEPE
jgi:predicted enzyme related to lactoylglutathione lyase